MNGHSPAKKKFAEIKIWPHHLPEMEKSLPRGILNANEPIWLAAFAVYNMNNNIRVSMEFDRSYTIVLNFLKLKLS